MKILQVVSALGPIYGGPSKIVVELAQAIGRAGPHVDLVTTDANGINQMDVPIATWIDSDGCRIQFFPYVHQLGEYKFSWSLSRWLYSHVSNYDLVHVQAIFTYPSLLAYCACYRHQVPYIVAPHGMLEPWAMSYKQLKKRLYYSFVEKLGLESANALHMTATPEAQRAADLKLGSPQVVIPNGIHRRDFDDLPTSETFLQCFPALRGKQLILFLGRIDPKKGLDLLAPAFARVHQLFPEAHLVVAGPDNIGFLSTAEEYFSRAGCLDAVTFVGMLMGELKMSALAAADIYVAPSHSEGFSMSVLEAMASGLPCVITTGCNFPEAATANAARVVNINAMEIADAIITYLEDPLSAAVVGEWARKFIFEHYTWDKVATKMIRVYEAILAHKSIPTFTSAEV